MAPKQAISAPLPRLFEERFGRRGDGGAGGIVQPAAAAATCSRRHPPVSLTHTKWHTAHMETS